MYGGYRRTSGRFPSRSRSRGSRRGSEVRRPDDVGRGSFLPPGYVDKMGKVDNRRYDGLPRGTLAENCNRFAQQRDMMIASGSGGSRTNSAADYIREYQTCRDAARDDMKDRRWPGGSASSAATRRSPHILMRDQQSFDRHDRSRQMGYDYPPSGVGGYSPSPQQISSPYAPHYYMTGSSRRMPSHHQPVGSSAHRSGGMGSSGGPGGGGSSVSNSSASDLRNSDMGGDSSMGVSSSMEGKIDDIIAENLVLRQLLLEQSSRIWKIGQILEAHGLGYLPNTKSFSSTATEGVDMSASGEAVAVSDSADYSLLSASGVCSDGDSNSTAMVSTESAKIPNDDSVLQIGANGLSHVTQPPTVQSSEVVNTAISFTSTNSNTISTNSSHSCNTSHSSHSSHSNSNSSNSNSNSSNSNSSNSNSSNSNSNNTTSKMSAGTGASSICATDEPYLHTKRGLRRSIIRYLETPYGTVRMVDDTAGGADEDGASVVQSSSGEPMALMMMTKKKKEEGVVKVEKPYRSQDGSDANSILDAGNLQQACKMAKTDNVAAVAEKREEEKKEEDDNVSSSSSCCSVQLQQTAAEVEASAAGGAGAAGAGGGGEGSSSSSGSSGSSSSDETSGAATSRKKSNSEMVVDITTMATMTTNYGSAAVGSLSEEERKKKFVNAASTVLLPSRPLGDLSTVRVGCSLDAVERRINEGLKRARGGGITILVEDGVYFENLNLSFPVRIVGIGSDVQIRHDRGNCLCVTSPGVVVENMQIRCDEEMPDGGTCSNHCITACSKNTVIQGCDLMTTRGHCIYIDPLVKGKDEDTDETTPFLVSVTVRDCRIHHASNCGIFMTGRCQLNLQNTLVDACGTAGVEARDQGELNVCGCKIANCSKSGVFAHSHARVNIVFSDVNNCGMAGIELSKMSKGRVLYSRVYHGLKGGVFVHDFAKMLLRENQIFANAMSNVDVRAKGKVDAELNKIFESRTSGVYVSAKGECVLRRNEIVRNYGNGIELNTGHLTCMENEIHENQRCALFANGECSGEVRTNDMRYNRDKSIGSHSKGRLPEDISSNKIDDGGHYRPIREERKGAYRDTSKEERVVAAVEGAVEVAARREKKETEEQPMVDVVEMTNAEEEFATEEEARDDERAVVDTEEDDMHGGEEFEERSEEEGGETEHA